MSALPKAVRKKISAGEKAHAAMYNSGEKPDETAPPVEEPPVKIVEPPADAPPETPPEAPAETPPGTPVEAPPAAATASGKEPATPAVDDEKWEHKYKVLNGKYVAEVPRLQKNIKDLGGQVTQLQSVLASIEKATPPETTPAARLLKAEEIEDYGEDLISVVKRAAREEMSPEMTRLEEENTELRRQMNSTMETSATTARKSVYDTLNEQVPNWEAINTDAEFMIWLDTFDAYTNQQRRVLLNDAFESNDAARVIAFFKGYLKENATVSPPGATEQPPAARTPAVDMASLAAPGKPRGGGSPGTQEGKQTWRQVEIAAFYADVRRGKFKGDPKTKLQLEKSIMDAVSSNRIVA